MHAGTAHSVETLGFTTGLYTSFQPGKKQNEVSPNVYGLAVSLRTRWFYRHVRHSINRLESWRGVLQRSGFFGVEFGVDFQALTGIKSKLFCLSLCV